MLSGQNEFWYDLYLSRSVQMLTLLIIVVLKKAKMLIRRMLNTRSRHLQTNAIYWQRRNNIIILLKKIRNSIYRFPHPWHHCTPWSNLAVWCTPSLENRIYFFLWSIILTSEFSQASCMIFKVNNRSHLIIDNKIIVFAK